MVVEEDPWCGKDSEGVGTIKKESWIAARVGEHENQVETTWSRSVGEVVEARRN